MPHLTTQIQRLIRDTAGNILPLAAVGMIVAAMVVGSAIDISRDYKARNQLQAACDAGVLAGRRTVTTNGFDTASETAARNYFATNFDDNAQETSGTVFTPSSTDSGQTVKGKATTTLNTLIMRLFGFNSFDISVSCASSMSVGNADVMMVLDTTGSMANSLGSSTRIKALQDAMKNFYNTLYSATSGSKARVRYGFVPYSSTVNIGNLIYEKLSPTYLADSWNYQSREATYIDYTPATKTKSQDYAGSGSLGDETLYSSSSYSKKNCTKSLPSAGPWVSGSPVTGYVVSVSGSGSNLTITRRAAQSTVRQNYKCMETDNSYYIYTYTDSSSTIKTETWTGAKKITGTPSSNSDFYSWTYKKVTRPTSTFKTGASTPTYTGWKGSAESSTWNGCIEERSTTTDSSFSYSSVSGYSPSTAYDINIDLAPTSDTATQWGPQWYQISYTRGPGTSNTSNWTTSDTSDGSSVTQYCPVEAQQLTEMSQSEFNAYANKLVAVGGTYLDIGMIWGGRMISPDGIFQANVNTAPDNKGEVSRHIIFMTDGEMDTSNYSTSAWGLEWWDHKVTTNGSNTTADSRHTSRFLAVCNAIKAKGVRVWVIAFTSSLSTDLQTCASENSSYTASDSDELNTAFLEIAKQIGELRITQ